MELLSVRQAAALWELEERRVTALCRSGRIQGAIKDGHIWLIPSDQPKPLDARTKESSSQSEKSDPQQTNSEDHDGIRYTTSGAGERVIQEFVKKYQKKPEAHAFTPYRICPIGAHSDFSLGRITGFAIDKGIHIAYGPKQNGVVEIASLQFPKRAQWHVTATPQKPQGDWADHLRGATIALNLRYPLRVGLSAVLDGELPIGGLSSSAAVIITFLNALCQLNGIHLEPDEMISVAQEAENKYVGVACGKLDQSCEVYCRKDSLLFMDFLDDHKEVIPKNPKMKPFEIAIFFSGLERSLAASKFNMRVDELRSAAYVVKALSGMEYGKYLETNMRDVPYETFLKYRSSLPENFAKRADHWYGEQDRVLKGVEAWKNGDIEAYGKLSFESGYSSIHSYETGCPELIKLYEIMTHTPGIYGGRFSGAGFKGCCMALIDPDYRDSILEQVEKEYLEAFPHLKGKFSAHICHTADGVHLRKNR